MELTPYLDGLRRDLIAAAAPGGPEILRAADLLAGSLDASARLSLLEALSDAAAEITTKLGHSGVEVRLHGREAQFVITDTDHRQQGADSPGMSEQPAPSTRPTPPDGDLTRITLRLPEWLKDSVERAAAAEAISTNAWLVRAISYAAGGPPGVGPRGEPPRRGRLGRHVTGFAQA